MELPEIWLMRLAVATAVCLHIFIRSVSGSATEG